MLRDVPTHEGLIKPTSQELERSEWRWGQGTKKSRQTPDTWKVVNIANKAGMSQQV